MRFAEVRLAHFRNVATATLPLSDSNFLVGLNGQGKTNVLEAVYCLSVGTSFRERDDSWLIELEQPWARVEADVEWASGEVQLLEMVVQQTELGLSKVFKLGGHRISRKELLARVPVVIFSPDDVKLLRYQPVFRRAWLDYLASRLDPIYLVTLTDYNKALRQRNQLLSLVRKHQASPGEITAWDQELARLGSYLVRQRAQVVRDMTEPTRTLLRRIVGDEGLSLGLTYKTLVADITAEQYQAQLLALRPEDIRMGRTSFGPHRDDVTILLSGHDARHFASQGEFRSIILALKVAEGHKLEQVFRETAVYLLDDVFSELDDERAQRVVELLGGAQAVFSSTTAPQPNGSTVKVFELMSGQVKEVDYELATS